MDARNIYPYLYTNPDIPIDEHNIESWLREHTKWKELQRDIMFKNSMPFVIK